MLDQVNVVLGPAADGGYYLVAARVSLPEVFVGVPMGTDRVLEVTCGGPPGPASLSPPLTPASPPHAASISTGPVPVSSR
jgi:Uncharacterized protein conserved in bacteria (DUF2064)